MDRFGDFFDRKRRHEREEEICRRSAGEGRRWRAIGHNCAHFRWNPLSCYLALLLLLLVLFILTIWMESTVLATFILLFMLQLLLLLLFLLPI